MTISKLESSGHSSEYALDNVAVVYTNFSGERFNDGKRSFDILLDDASAAYLKGEGFYVSPFKHERKDGIKYHLNVKLKFDGARPPHIYMYTSKAKVVISADNAKTLDGANIVSADIVIRQNVYDDGAASAWLNEMHATIEEEYFASKYAKYDTSDDDDGMDLPF